jgi:hypothetical protein
LIGDFKKFTSKQLKSNIEQTEPSMLSLFLDNEGHYQFWMNTNAPKKIDRKWAIFTSENGIYS